MLVCQKVIPRTTPWMVKLYDSGTGLCIPLWLLGTCTIASIYHRLYEHTIVIGLVFINLVPVVIVGLIQYILTYYKMDWIDFIKKRTRVIYHGFYHVYAMLVNATHYINIISTVSWVYHLTGHRIGGSVDGNPWPIQTAPESDIYGIYALNFSNDTREIWGSPKFIQICHQNDTIYLHFKMTSWCSTMLNHVKPC